MKVVSTAASNLQHGLRLQLEDCFKDDVEVGMERQVGLCLDDPAFREGIIDGLDHETPGQGRKLQLALVMDGIAGPVEVILPVAPPAAPQFLDEVIAEHLRIEFAGHQLPDEGSKTTGEPGYDDEFPPGFGLLRPPQPAA